MNHMQKKELVSIKDYTTFHLGGRVRVLCHITSEEDLEECVQEAKNRNLPILALGEGSNLIFAQDMIEAVVAKIEIKGFSVLSENDRSVSLLIGAGEHWDGVVARTVRMNLSGLEAMSAIPGTAGATPVQNVGAYGQEIQNTLVDVRAYDTKKNQFVNLSNQECQFSYRDSIFRSVEKNRYLITFLTLKLSKTTPSMPDYLGVKKYFKEKNISTPTVRQIREAIIEIRSTKLPDPKKIWNVGSFFKNPILMEEDRTRLRNTYPSMPTYLLSDGKIKLSAGWLIEQSGFKGKDFGQIKVYEHNALVLVNKGHATFFNLATAQKIIVEEIKKRFGVILEPEPLFIE